MHFRYIFTPRNPMLHHCSESFYKAMTLKNNDEGEKINLCLLDNLDFINSLSLIQNLFKLNSGDTISIFFFLIQTDYLLLTFVTKIVAKLFNKNLKIYYMMHEPKFEKRRINPIKSYLVYLYHLLFGYLGDKILLPSDKAFIKAQSFITLSKLHKINLSFISPSESLLKNNLLQLKCSWNNAKTFSLLGRGDQDKNPQGFLSLAKVIHQYYPGNARFIRGGRDRNVQVPYDEELIIRFPGFISTSAKRFLFSLTHFIVIPYSFSTQSGVIVEALSYGKLLIVNDIPAFSHLKGLNFVFLIDFNDENAISTCIHKLFNMDIFDYESRYCEAIKYFQENHSENYLSNALKDIL